MKKIKLLLIICLAISFKLYAPNQCFDYSTYINKVIKINDELELNLFLEDLGFSETSTINHPIYKRTGLTPYTIINKCGAAGKWQITAIARKDIGYKGTLKQFLNDSIIQRNCMIKLMKKNVYYLNYYLPNYENYIGKVIYGVLITYSGILAACHLAGVGNVKKFLLYGYNANDGNKTTKCYLKQFSNYNLNII